MARPEPEPTCRMSSTGSRRPPIKDVSPTDQVLDVVTNRHEALAL